MKRWSDLFAEARARRFVEQSHTEEARRQEALLAEQRAMKERAAQQRKVDRQRANRRREIERGVEDRMARLAPLGTPVERAVEAVIGDLRVFERDQLRPTFVSLAQKLVEPDEQILGLIARGRFNSSGWDLLAIATTRGFACKVGKSRFRTDTSVVETEVVESFGTLQGQAHGIFGTVYHSDSEGGLYQMARCQVALQRKTIEQSKMLAHDRTARPKPRLIRTARDAELNAVDWMIALGFSDAMATPIGADAGVDVISREAVAQVKAETKPVGRPAVQQHHGVARSLNKRAVFFSLSGYTPQARTWAEENGLILFTFDLQGDPIAANPAAYSLFESAGLL